MNPLQRASRNRKIAYFGVILALFTVSMVWRGMIPVPLGASTARAAEPFRWAANHTIQSQAQRLEVWESDPSEGEAEITGSAARLALTGSRGFVVTGLWLSAIEKQKRNDFHEFEQRVQMVTKLQPNFITPWIFQSWNIAYNVSVEMHGSGDMYYYIVRGIQLLAEGERRNRRSPDMRYQIAFYYQNKFGVSDQVEVLRCLYDLSCMPPSERDPDNLTVAETGALDPEKFKRFCARHPHFVRRLRGEEAPPQDKRAKEKLRAATPDEILLFLKTHYQDLPNRYRRNPSNEQQWTDSLNDPDKQFPALPPQFNEGPNEAHPGVATPADDAPIVGYFSAFKAARAWFTYSLLLLPPPLKDEEGKPIPGPTPPPGTGGHDPSKHRVPRLPTMIIFRQGAPRAQSYAAELEQKEGWFDGEGWRIDDPAANPNAWWFPDSPNPALRSRPQDVVVGTGRPWSLLEWQRAADLWRLHGQDYALSLTLEQFEKLQKLAGDATNLPYDANPDQIPDENLRRRAIAAQALRYYSTNRQTTNFPYFLASAQAEAREINGQPTTVLARKQLWKADQARKSGNKPLALRLYKDGLEQWRRVLADNPQFHRPSRGTDRTEEETFEYELAYLRLLVQDDDRVRERANQIAHATHAVVPFLSVPFPRGDGGQGGAADPLWPEANREDIKWWVVENVAGADFSSPFVGSLAADGSPWVRDEVKESVRSKQGVSRRAAPAAPSDPATPPPAPPGG